MMAPAEPAKAPPTNGNGGSPRTLVEAGGRVATDMVRGLSQSPLLLGVIVLNILGLGAGSWVALSLFAAIERASINQREMFLGLMKEARGEQHEILKFCLGP